MGISAAPYSSYFQPVVPPMAGFDSPDAALAQQSVLAGDINRQRQQQSFDQLNNFDPENEESVKGLSRLAALGQVPSTTANALLRQSRFYDSKSGKVGKNSPYNDAGSNFLSELYQQDWSDPRALQAVIPDIIKRNPDALNDPRVANTMQQIQQHLLTAKQPKQVDENDWKQTIPSRFINRAGLAVQNLANFSSKLGTEQDVPGGLPAIQQNIANRNAVHGAIKTLRGYGLTPEQLAEEIAGAGLQPEAWMGDQPPATFEPSDADKEAAIKAHGLVDALGKPDYHAAYYVAQGLKPPARATGAATAAQPQSQPQIPTFNTPEEAESSNVPVGTVVMVGGKKFKKI